MQTKTSQYYVYFIYEDPPHPTKPVIKIGESKNPQSRLRNLQTGNKNLLKIYKTIRCPDKQYAKRLEGSLHQRYLKKCLGGEWFEIHFKDVDYICHMHEQLQRSQIPIEYFVDILVQDQTPHPPPPTRDFSIPFIPV